MSRIVCAVFRSRRNPETYIFVDHHEGFARVPEALLRELGGTDRAMTLALHRLWCKTTATQTKSWARCQSSGLVASRSQERGRSGAAACAACKASAENELSKGG